MFVEFNKRLELVTQTEAVAARTNTGLTSIIRRRYTVALESNECGTIFTARTLITSERHGALAQVVAVLNAPATAILILAHNVFETVIQTSVGNIDPGVCRNRNLGRSSRTRQSRTRSGPVRQVRKSSPSC